ncbi:hypothetical protein R1flu_019881 [Riccia fluitans]|uniref:Fe2OG dioxygenase domain-containing protein n=1 Tax=Riccia fluitans TaxID=41844 RepID=A0ABD1ZK56_9MARC
MAVQNSDEGRINVCEGDMIPGPKIREAAKLLLQVVDDPEMLAGLCTHCTPILRERLLQLSLTSGDFRIVNNAKETSTEAKSSVCKASPVIVEKPKLWSEESFSSSEEDEEPSSSRDCEELAVECDPAVSAPQNTHIGVCKPEIVQETVTTRAFKTEKENMQFAWANVALPSPGGKDDRNGAPSPRIGKEMKEVKDPGPLSREIREELRFHAVRRKKDFQCIEWVRGTRMNVAAGLELHTGVFSTVEQKRLVQLVEEFQEKGRNRLLRERTYSEPRKWMRGKGRVTIQFGCCYNYAVDKKRNPPGIIYDEMVDPLPDLLRKTIRRLVRWHVLPPTCVPDSCIINIYDEGDCIPPHIDHHDFVRPFCTLSLLSECNIVFGSELKIAGPGEFEGPLVVPLPVGSVLVLNGNGADVAKHAVPAVPTKRISITFRKMDPKKVPKGYVHPKDLENVAPFEVTGTVGHPR